MISESSGKISSMIIRVGVNSVLGISVSRIRDLIKIDLQ
jgi:hypothetical protein